MNKYHKIVTVYERDPDTRYKYLIEGRFANPEFAYLSEDVWNWSEKVDGTNIRVMWDEGRIRYGGKTDNAQIPAFLVNQMDEMFSVDTFNELYPALNLCLYGEGFGAKIQKGGGNYIPDSQSFILFDVRVGDFWLQRLDGCFLYYDYITYRRIGKFCLLSFTKRRLFLYKAVTDTRCPEDRGCHSRPHHGHPSPCQDP